jgi:phosphomethylpyrimidine synthase
MAISKARRDLDWESQFQHALFARDAERIRSQRLPECDPKVCTMCGEFCANRAASGLFAETLRRSQKA